MEHRGFGHAGAAPTAGPIAPTAVGGNETAAAGPAAAGQTAVSEPDVAKPKAIVRSKGKDPHQRGGFPPSDPKHSVSSPPPPFSTLPPLFFSSRSPLLYPLSSLRPLLSCIPPSPVSSPPPHLRTSAFDHPFDHALDQMFDQAAGWDASVRWGIGRTASLSWGVGVDWADCKYQLGCQCGLQALRGGLQAWWTASLNQGVGAAAGKPVSRRSACGWHSRVARWPRWTCG